jgi:hypothetical protein
LKKQIQDAPGKRDVTIDNILKHFVDKSVPLYRTELNEIIYISESERMCKVDTTFMQNIINKIITLKSSSIRVNCTKELANQVLVQLSTSDSVKLIRNTLQIPVLEFNLLNSVYHTSGYVESIQSYIFKKVTNHAEKSWLEPKLLKNQEHLEKAVRNSLSPFEHYLFEDSADKGVLFILLLTLATRFNCKTSPAFMVSASSYGTGKSDLCMAASLLLTSSPSIITPNSNRGDELVKRLDAAYISRSPVIIVDNLVDDVSNIDIASNITSPVIQIRKFGSQNVHSVSNDFVLLFNGNNIHPDKDNSRRFCRIRLKSKEGQLTSGFPFVPSEKMDGMLESVLCDLHSLLLTYMTVNFYSDTPTDFDYPKLGSFEDWSMLVLGCYHWLDTNGYLPDDLKGAIEHISHCSENSSDTVNLGTLFELAKLIQNTKKKETFQSRDILSIWQDQPSSSIAALCNSLEDAECFKRTNPASIGKFLAKNINRPLNGEKLTIAGKSSGANTFKLVSF